MHVGHYNVCSDISERRGVGFLFHFLSSLFLMKQPKTFTEKYANNNTEYYNNDTLIQDKLRVDMS